MARKRGMQFIPYDYEAAYNKAMEDMHEWFIENLFQHRKKVIYALKEITAGDQFEIEIYPQFRSMDEVPPEGRTIKKDNNKAQKNLNDKNAKVDVAHGFNKSLAGTYKVTASGLNLRAGAGTGKSILAVMKNGEKVQCYGYYNDCNGVKWLYVVYKNIVGYASSKYLSK